MTLIESEQTRDIGLTEVKRGPFALRYAYYRKREDAQPGISGEDYIVSELTSNKVIFCLCDGVGSSFYGNLGSQILGEVLLDWLGDLNTPDSAYIGNDEKIKTWTENLNILLRKKLDNTIEFATSVIQKKQLPSENEFMQLSYNMNREDHGTQSNFVGGVVWRKSSHLPNGLVLLFWLGNARIRIFKEKNDLTPLTEWGSNPDQLKEVWSSKDGVIGTIYSYCTDLASVTNIIAYSDGLESVDQLISPNLDALALNSIVDDARAIKDDDVSFLEVCPSDMHADNYIDDIVPAIRSYLNSSKDSIPQNTMEELQEVKKKADYLNKEKENLQKELAKAKKVWMKRMAIAILLAISLGIWVGAIIESRKIIVITTPTYIPATTFPPTLFSVPPTIDPPNTPTLSPTLSDVTAFPTSDLMYTPTMLPNTSGITLTTPTPLNLPPP
jgi:hypothetical protein